MNALAKIEIVGSNGSLPALRNTPRIQKANATNTFYDDRAAYDAPRAATSQVRVSAKLSQIETADYEPDWNGPRLTASFAAQVLGQVLAGNKESGSAASAYHSLPPIFSALLHDRQA